jgi:hypothetical protein
LSANPQPIVVAADRESFSRLCDQCVREKNAPMESGRAWAPGEGHEDVTVSGTLPFGQDELWVECPHGHRHLVLRQGSERARNFGF